MCSQFFSVRISAGHCKPGRNIVLDNSSFYIAIYLDIGMYTASCLDYIMISRMVSCYDENIGDSVTMNHTNPGEL